MIPDGLDGTLLVEVDRKRVHELALRPGNLSMDCPIAFERGSVHDVRISADRTTRAGDDLRDLAFFLEGVSFDTFGAAPFVCNLCGRVTPDLDEALDPEGSPCRHCGSNMRLRYLVRLIAMALYGRSMAIPDWPARKDVTALGVSDDKRMAKVLPRAIDYRNTQFDPALLTGTTLQLDIADPPENLRGTAEIVTCSEVLEHVVPPVQRAFEGLYGLLQPGGTLVFTVPFSLGETVEHFAELHDWYFDRRDGERIIVNRTADGRMQEFSNLRFHGGGEDVLEMREFGLPDLFAHLEGAGFKDVRVRDESDLHHGICLKYAWSLPITGQR